MSSAKAAKPDYETMKKQIEKKKATLVENHAAIPEIKSFLFSAINDSIIPYWFGTPWDFNGTTEKPGNGMIACGYFVTTVLRDAGFPVQRIKLAQKASSEIINEICKKESIKWLHELADLEIYLNKTDANGIFILGLDLHVGFVIRENGINYFAHSNYMGKAVVEKQLLRDAQPVLLSQVLVIGNVLENETLLQSWADN